MKKYLLDFAAILAAGFCLTGCLDNQEYEPTAYEFTGNAYVVNSGNMYGNIAGSLTSLAFDLLDSTKCTITQKAFEAKNGVALGMVPNDAVIYGTKMYLAVDKSNVIWVVDRLTLQLIKQVSTTDLMGAEAGSEPRRLAAGDGKVFFTTFGGYIAAIDTTSYALTYQFQSGSYPEAIAATTSYMFVANSDYAQGKNPSISRFDIHTGTRKDITQGVNNPTELALCNGCMFVLDGSTYNDDYSIKTQCDSIAVINGEEIIHLQPANLMAPLTNSSSYTSCLYLASFETDSVRYYTYTPYGTSNPKGGTVKTFITGGPKYPACMTADPNTGYVFIAYYEEGANGYADYSSPAHVNVYNNDGGIVQKDLQVGICPARITLNRTITYY